MRKQSPPRNENATWLVARSCSAAIVALPLFVVSALSGQTTDEADIGVSHLAEAVLSANGNDPLAAMRASLDETAHAVRWSKPRHSGKVCVWCEDRRLAGVWWHRVPQVFIVGWSFGHGLHERWLHGTCALYHPGLCSLIWWPSSEPQTLTAQELARGISDAVAARDVETLAVYANVPSVSLFAGRSAIQIRGCDGETIVGHIPVHPELLAAIGAAAAQLEPGG